MPTPFDTLFLHWGPGMSAHVERHLLGATHPRVYFWDQPSVTQEHNALAVLLDAACAEVARIHQATGRPVKLMAHSFGGHLVSGLLARIPEKIGDCHLVSTGYDIAGGFRNLLKIMAVDTATEDGLRDAIHQRLATAEEDTSDRPSIWNDIDLAFSDPDVVRHYWPHPEQYQAYVDIASSGPALDFDTFRNVLNDYIANHFGRQTAYQGHQQILIELGGKDPILAIDLERRSWLTRFPSAQIVSRPDSGHFIHLEPFCTSTSQMSDRYCIGSSDSGTTAVSDSA